jgi:LacI family transcriptional regulator
MPRKRGVSIRDVAALAGVSSATVSNVLNAPELVAEATRDRVLDAIEKLRWVPNEPARQLRAGRSRTVAMVVMDIANPYFTDVVAGVDEFVEAEGYSVHIGNSAQSSAREIQHLTVFERQRVSGVLLVPIGDVLESVSMLRLTGMPVVIVDRDGGHSEYCSVSVDDVEGGRLAVEHLIQCGHRRLGFVGGPTDLTQVRDRHHGAERAIAESTESDLTLLAVPTLRLDVASGRAAADELVALPVDKRPTGVFAANDLLAIGLLQGFVAHGLQVPDDVAIVGYDDIDFAAAAAVPLSSIRQPRKDIGRQAAEFLFDEMKALEDGSMHQHRHVQFTPVLAARASTLGSGSGVRR